MLPFVTEAFKMANKEPLESHTTGTIINKIIICFFGRFSEFRESSSQVFSHTLLLGFLPHMIAPHRIKYLGGVLADLVNDPAFATNETRLVDTNFEAVRARCVP